MSQLIVRSGGPLCGSVRVPGDKSVSHRALLLGALAEGNSHISGFLPSGDCHATLACLRALGVEIDTHTATTLTVHGCGQRGLLVPDATNRSRIDISLDCARSGTTMRLLAGILAGQAFGSALTGHQQLLIRPMRRVVEPLRRMGAEIQDTDGHAPLAIHGRRLHGHDHTLPVASAQVKSALLLAGLYADGRTIVRQPGPARDHTERMLAEMGASIETVGLTVSLEPRSSLSPFSLDIPGDISSAAFLLVAAMLVPGSEITVDAVGVNPTRTGLLDVLRAMGAEVAISARRIQGREPVANVTMRASALQGVEVSGDAVVRMIDEFPALAVAATQAHGTTIVRDAAELRVKETDRVATVVTNLQKLGAHIAPLPDGFIVQGPTPLRGAVVDSHGDHRLAMALAVAGLISDEEVVVRNSACIGDSFPGYVDALRGLGAEVLTASALGSDMPC